MNCIVIAESPSPEVELAAKAEGLKEQYGKASGDARSVTGDELIDAQMALVDVLVAKKDFTGAQNVLKQTVVVASTIKSEKTKAVMARLSSVSIRKTMVAKVDGLRDALIRKPNDPETTRQLVDLLVLELEDVHGAKDASAGLNDKALSKALGLMEKDPALLTGAEAKELATWYAAAAKRHKGTTQGSALAKEAALLKAALAQPKLESGIKTQLQAMLDGLPADVKAGADATAMVAQAPAGTVTPAVMASWFKNLPKDLATARDGSPRASKVRDYVRENRAGEMGKTARFRGTVNQRVSFRKSEGKWQVELSVDVDMPADSVRMRSHVRAWVTEAQMGKMSELQNMSVEVEGTLRDLYVYSSGGDQAVIYGVFLTDGKLLSFK